MKASNLHPDEEQGPAQADPAFSDVLSAWEQYFTSLKVKYRTQLELLVADFRLSLKAVVVALFCVLGLTGLLVISWAMGLYAIFLGLQLVGVHWALALLGLFFINILVAWLMLITLKSALVAIEFKTTWQHLFSSPNKV
ncbi:hypothetical protein [Paraglaciecola aestuariivivens]